MKSPSLIVFLAILWVCAWAWILFGIQWPVDSAWLVYVAAVAISVFYLLGLSNEKKDGVDE